jgi:hypothetical protein
MTAKVRDDAYFAKDTSNPRLRLDGKTVVTHCTHVVDTLI